MDAKQRIVKIGRIIDEEIAERTGNRDGALERVRKYPECWAQLCELESAHAWARDVLVLTELQSALGWLLGGDYSEESE